MGCASRTRDVSPVPVGGRLAHAEPRPLAGFLEPKAHAGGLEREEPRVRGNNAGVVRSFRNPPVRAAGY
jgi:hypothetical protein